MKLWKIVRSLWSERARALPFLKRSLRSKAMPVVLEVSAALAIGAVMIQIAGANPAIAYFYLIEGAFGSVSGIVDVLLRSTPLIMAGVGIIVAFKCRVMNLGAEGQIYMGGIMSAWIGIVLGGLPAFVHLPLTAAAGFFSGGLWASIAGILKVKLRVNELITFLMLNYIAILFTDYLLTGPMQEPGFGYPVSPLLSASSWLPLFPGSRLHVGFLLAIVAVFSIYVLIQRTKIGYRIRVIGSSPEMASYGGIKVSSTMMLAMFLSGGLAGLAGSIEILGIHHRLLSNFSPGYGWTGLAVARAAGLNPLISIPVGLFFGGLYVGVDSMAREVNIPVFLSLILYSLIVVFIIAGEGLREILSERRKKLG